MSWPDISFKFSRMLVNSVRPIKEATILEKGTSEPVRYVSVKKPKTKAVS
jgi:hypothetical protein